ncbi:hypothetical protein D917_08501, partial [Trichinella nativa]
MLLSWSSETMHLSFSGMIHYYLPLVKARWSYIQNIGIFPFHRAALSRYW